MTTIMDKFKKIKDKTDEMGLLMDNKPDPTCKFCKGTGLELVRTVGEVEQTLCDCVKV